MAVRAIRHPSGGSGSAIRSEVTSKNAGRRPGGRTDGPAVVLLAGFPQTWTWWAWRKVMPGLADRFRVLALDLPAQGHSERPRDGYDTHTAAARVHAAVQALGARSCRPAAHDIGAWVAFSLP